MVLLTTALMPLSVLASWNYITTRERGFYALMLILLTGLVGVFIALDMFLFYVFFEVMLIPMYFIIGIWGGANRLYAAIKFFIYTMTGSLLMLVAIVVLVWKVQAATGPLSFSYDHLLRNASAVGGAAPWLFAAFALAFAIKVPIFPFHTWLPDAHVEAPTAGSVLLAAVMLKIGTYGFLRFAVPFFPQVALSPFVSRLMVTLAIIGIVYGALVALVQPDIKKLVAYSSVSHLGFVMLGIWGGTVQSVQGALMVMISHGFSTGALFLLIGMLYERRHTRLIEDYGGIARVVPVFSLILTVVALSSIGLPGLNGFVGEFLVLLGSFAAFPWATGIATTGVIFAAAYLLWALQRMIFNRLDDRENEHLTRSLATRARRDAASGGGHRLARTVSRARSFGGWSRPPGTISRPPPCGPPGAAEALVTPSAAAEGRPMTRLDLSTPLGVTLGAPARDPALRLGAGGAAGRELAPRDRRGQPARGLAQLRRRGAGGRRARRAAGRTA